MTKIRARLDRLEQGNAPKVWGRFICVRAGECTDEQASDYLRKQGITVGPRDIVLIDTHENPGTSVDIAAGETVSHQVVECTERIEDMIARLD